MYECGTQRRVRIGDLNLEMRFEDESYMALPNLFISCGCCNRLRTNWWLNTTEIHSFTVWKPEVQNQGVSGVALPLETPGESPFLTSSFWGLPVILHLCCDLVATTLQAPPLWSHCLLLLSLSNLPCVSLMRTLVIGYKTNLNNPGWSLHLRFLNLTTTAKTSFPKWGNTTSGN